MPIQNESETLFNNLIAICLFCIPDYFIIVISAKIWKSWNCSALFLLLVLNFFFGGGGIEMC